MNIFQKLKEKLTKTSSSISNGIAKVLVHKKLDEELLEDLKDLLIMADVGVAVSDDIITALAKEKFSKEVTEEEVKEFIADRLCKVLSPLAKPIEIKASPNVLLVCGVNGNGKTTTIGKMALKYKAEGKQVMICACDTFRAAAIEQLQAWGEKAGCPVVIGQEGSDPASVAFNAYQQAKQEGYDILLIDTAGRLQNKKNLMLELEKITRVLKKIDETAPHNIILLLDATTGMNAISQVKNFNEAVDISGLVVTKLDGSAKAGILLPIAKEFGLPIHFIGIGEGIDDLQKFDAENFSRALLF